MTGLRRYVVLMAHSIDRVVVLLGAGASADADLPLTSGLAQMVVQKANDADAQHGGLYPSRSGFVTALNAVYASMVGHQGQKGNPLTAVNIETLISAVRLLQNRDRHEVAPFVAAWSAAVSDFPSASIPSDPGRKIAEAIAGGMLGRHVRGDEISGHIATIAKAALRPDLAQPFLDAENFVLKSLVEILSAIGSVDYLKPLMDLARTQERGLAVITLNYDLTVETAARQYGVEVARGIESWQPGATIDLPPRDGILNLLKLHGSLDWRRERPERNLARALTPPRLRVVEPQVLTAEASVDDLPWIVVGDREKLATDGPTLPLHFAARQALSEGSHLAVVGYSFGDAHINAMIRDWLGADASRTISILDKYWERHRYWTRASDFKSLLVDEYGRDRTTPQDRVQPRLVAVEGTTSEALGLALSARPASTPTAFVSAIAKRSETALRIAVTWHGNDLTDARITARTPSPRGTSSEHVKLFDTKDMSDDEYFQNVSVPRLARGQTIEVFASALTALPFEVSVEGSALAGSGSGRVVVTE